MPAKYSIERFVRVYDDSSGAYYEIRPDTDGLGCVEIRYSDGRGLDLDRCLTVPPEMAEKIADALREVAASVTKQR